MIDPGPTTGTSAFTSPQHAPLELDGPVLRAVRVRRSRARVGRAAPDDADVETLLGAAAGVADHAALRPWRVISLRGAARERLGAAMVEAAGSTGIEAERLAAKTLRAPLLLGIVFSPVEHPKATEWEQAATTSGVAHVLSLLLDEQGWGVIWRTGSWIDTSPVRALHELADHERLLGWLYVGEREGPEPAPRVGLDLRGRLSPLGEHP